MRKLWTILTLVAAMLFVSVAAAQTGPGTSVGLAVGSTAGSAARSHNVVVTIPSVILLRLDGSNNATVTFDFSTEAQTYANAALTSTPLNPTASDMSGLEVFTNDPNGAKVQITLSGGSTGGDIQAQSDLLFDGVSVASWNSSHSGASYLGNVTWQNVFSTGFAQSGGVVTSSPITFAPSVLDLPGNFTITVTYTATTL